MEVVVSLPQLLHFSPVHLLQLMVEALGLVSLVLLVVLLGITLNWDLGSHCLVLNVACLVPHIQKLNSSAG